MRNKTQVAATTARLLENARYEVLPTASIEDKLLEHVPVDRTITVTASPSKGLEPTLDLTERLTGHGYVAVPHLAARMVRDRAELEEICDRLSGKGITKIFVPGGDADPPGAYHDALSLLEDLKEIGHPFEQVGITGYPESHPTIADDLTINTAITLPIGVETYAAYALWVWLSGRAPHPARQFAKWSAIGSLVFGAAGQVAYHLMASAGMTAAPWVITAAVACLPVAVLGMGAALAHLLHSTDH
jgi:hypothetical protein